MITNYCTQVAKHFELFERLLAEPAVNCFGIEKGGYRAFVRVGTRRVHFSLWDLDDDKVGCIIHRIQRLLIFSNASSNTYTITIDSHSSSSNNYTIYLET